MQVPSHIFREYDIRGLVDEELSPDLARALGRAFATFVRRKLETDSPSLALGRDVRPSSGSPTPTGIAAGRSRSRSPRRRR